MKIFVTGANGQLGKCLNAVLTEHGHTVIAPSHAEMDITECIAVHTHIDNAKPQIVIHCAAYNKVDAAEKDVEACFAVNATGTENVVGAAKRIGAQVIFISTDYVFDGKKTGAYLPDDTRSPLSVYGRSKMLGEDITLSMPQNAVVRTSWLFGASESNFVRSILCAAQERAELKVVSNQIGSPTYAYDLAQMLSDFVDTGAVGVFHGTNTGICSRAEYAREIIKLAGLNCRIVDVQDTEYPAAAKRPRNSVLDGGCLRDIGIAPLPEWQDGLRRYISTLM